MEDLVDEQFWRDRRVLITGHTGFKGAWLSFWLNELGAEVHGLALEPNCNPHLFGQFRLIETMDHAICDIRYIDRVIDRVTATNPEVVFHLAAMPLVLQSFDEPLETWQINLTGSLHLLEALRLRNRPCVAVMVTTDKVYSDQGTHHHYSEHDRLGGHDPYSASKTALEIAVESWRSAYFIPENERRVRVAAARAGNVIGGGDWGTDRLVPDIVRALLANREIVVRNPSSVRPWQHVLDALAGYIRLAQLLMTSGDSRFERAWNFGPRQSEVKSVQDLVEEVIKLWPGTWSESRLSDVDKGREAGFLSLSTKQAREYLGFEPRWNFQETIRLTVDWYRSVGNGADACEVTRKQIADYGPL